LATHLGARNRGVLLVEHADGARREQKAHDALLIRARLEARVEVHHRGHDPRGAVRRRGDHAAAGRILFVDRQRPGVHPVHDIERAAGTTGAALRLRQHPIELRCPAPYLEHAGKHTGLAEATLDALLHDVPELEETLAYLRLRSPG